MTKFTLSEQQINHFHTEGYLIIEDVLDNSALQLIRDEYSSILDRVSPQLVANGQVSQDYAALPFEERYTSILHELDDMYAVYQYLDISLPLISDMTANTTLNTGPAVFSLITHPYLLDIAEAFVGPEIYSNPVQHARIKPPKSALPAVSTDSNIARTMWHQDEAVLTPDVTDQVDMLTMWVAMTDATEENGCLICLPGSHREEVILHCPGNGFSASEIFIPEALIPPDDAVTLPVRKGGVVLLNQRTRHGSLDNYSEQIRWSFDLRYQPVGQPSGRDIFPGFVARSATYPNEVLTDPQEWAKLWYDKRDAIVAGEVQFDVNERWTANGGHQLCA